MPWKKKIVKKKKRKNVLTVQLPNKQRLEWNMQQAFWSRTRKKKKKIVFSFLEVKSVHFIHDSFKWHDFSTVYLPHKDIQQSLFLRDIFPLLPPSFTNAKNIPKQQRLRDFKNIYCISTGGPALTFRLQTNFKLNCSDRKTTNHAT